jgi:hypothetical protein
VLLAIASLRYQWLILVLLVVQTCLYVPYLKAVGKAIFEERGKIASTVLLYAVFLYSFAFIVFYMMPKYHFQEFSSYHIDDHLSTENITLANFLTDPEAFDNRNKTLYFIKNMNNTNFTTWSSLTVDPSLPPPQTRPEMNYTMWSIVQNFAEF